ncbi:MAG: tyrosine-type recombinase/integrase [Alphaproteobacteria bacterium]
MTTEYPGLQKVKRKLQSGSVAVHYYWRSPRRKLPGQPGDFDFDKAYAELSAESEQAADVPETFGHITMRYLASDEFDGLAESTQKEYLRSAKKLRAYFGSLPTRLLDDKLIRQEFKKYHTARAEDGKRASDHDISVLKVILNWAVEQSWIAHNHAAKLKRKYKSDRSNFLWRAKHFDVLFDALEGHTNANELRLAAILAIYTGQRQGDLLKLCWTHIDAYTDQSGVERKYIRYKQSKGDVDIMIPLHQDLLPWLEATPKRAITILTNREGHSWTSSGFKSSWQKAKVRAGKYLEDLHFHDLRGTAVTHLADAGCTNPEIAAITGHSLERVEQILKYYLIGTTKQAVSAVDKSEASGNLAFLNKYLKL